MYWCQYFKGCSVSQLCCDDTEKKYLNFTEKNHLWNLGVYNNNNNKEIDRTCCVKGWVGSSWLKIGSIGCFLYFAYRNNGGKFFNERITTNFCRRNNYLEEEQSSCSVLILWMNVAIFMIWLLSWFWQFYGYFRNCWNTRGTGYNI